MESPSHQGRGTRIIPPRGEIRRRSGRGGNGTAIPGLKFTFGITVESELARNRDLNKDVKDKLALIDPEVNVALAGGNA